MVVRRVKEGVYDIDVTYRKPDGEKVRARRRVTGNKPQAIRAESKLREALIDGTYNAPRSDENTTLSEFAKDFLATYAATNNKPSERQSKETIIRLHLEPTLGALPLRDIGTKQIEELKAAKMSGGDAVGPRTMNNILTCLRTLLNEAIEWGLIASMPRVKWVKVPPNEFDFLGFDEAAALILGADEGCWRAMVLTGLRTGMRLGELIGLDRPGVDFDAGVIRVHQSYVRGVLGSPKNHKGREIPMSPALRKELRSWMNTHRFKPVFTETGHRLEKGQCKWPLWRACKAAELRRIGWHVLRHTFASHLVMRGVPLNTVRELMGHSTIAMTERYAHLAPDVKAAAVNLLDSVDPLLTRTPGFDRKTQE